MKQKDPEQAGIPLYTKICKHASWLNAAEIEINVMNIECTGRRIDDVEMLVREVAARTRKRRDHRKKSTGSL
jgi:hypothetical protein